jgi:hypothetical protein
MYCRYCYNKLLNNTGRSKEKKRKDEDEDYVESKLSKSIIQQARLQVKL